MLKIIGVLGLIALIIAVLTAYFKNKSDPAMATIEHDFEGWLTGSARPRQIPSEWQGEPLPDGAGWRWFNPENRGDSVRMYRAGPQSADPSIHEPYVIVTVNGQIIGRDGQPLGEYLSD